MRQKVPYLKSMVPVRVIFVQFPLPPDVPIMRRKEIPNLSGVGHILHSGFSTENHVR